ncbi:MAG: 3-methyl-2-oxobutanoate hydroxymethyltransferase [Anaerolineales bacterium]
MSATPNPNRKKVTTSTLRAKKARGEPITMLTAYDFPTAQAIDRAGIDAILVGDSLGMVVLGYDTTLPVTMEDMLHHCKAVARGASTAHLIGDMPFMSYQVSEAEAVRNAGRFLQEAGMDAIKLEGGRGMVPTISAIVAAGIPVMGHIGLTPQSVHQLGGFKTQGKSAEAARALVADAHALEAAGCYALVLEAIPDRLAELISQRLTIPTIGIGAGSGSDGQVLVTYDLLGLFDGFTPKFVKQYAALHAEMARAFGAYREDVLTHHFPAAEHSTPMDDQAFRELLTLLETEPIA